VVSLGGLSSLSDPLKALGDSAFKKGNYAAALSHYESALASSSRSQSRFPLLSNRCAALLCLSRYTEAIAAADVALLDEDAANTPLPVLAKLYRRKGQAQHKLMKLEEALDSYKTAQVLDADFGTEKDIDKIEEEQRTLPTSIDDMSISGEPNLRRLSHVVSKGGQTMSQLRRKIQEFRYGRTELEKSTCVEKRDVEKCLLRLIEMDIVFLKASRSAVPDPGADTEAGGPADHSRDFVGHIVGFVRHREAIDNEWRKCCKGAKSSVEQIPTVDRLEKEGSFDGNLRQMALTTSANEAPRHVENLEELYIAARAAHDIFKTLILCTVPSELASLGFSFAANFLGGTTKDSFVVPETKGEARAKEKATDDYGSRSPGPKEAWLFDIVRGAVLCDSEDEIGAVIEVLKKHVEIIRLKNRFKHCTPAGFRDININLRMKISEGVYHIAELQIHHRTIKEFSKNSRSHEHYEVRTLCTLLTRAHTDVVKHANSQTISRHLKIPSLTS
jgi:tetratricopeptide (TPR) repeat protein